MGQDLVQRAGFTSRAFALLAVVAFLLSACGGGIRGEPERYRSIDEELQSLTPAYGDSELAKPGSTSRARRNEIIGARMYAIDLRFSEFETELLRESRKAGFGTVLVELIVDISGSLASNGASQILSAISAGITGTKEAFDKEILVEQTVQSLINQMRASRDQIAARIYGRLDLSVADYPLTVALADVEEYYQAGTLAGSLVNLSETTGVAAEAAKVERTEAIKAGFVEDDASRVLLEMLYDDYPTNTVVNTANESRMLAWLEARGFGENYPVDFFISADIHAEDREAMVEFFAENQ